jgi:hypothetical protein
MYTCCGWGLPSCDDQLLHLYVYVYVYVGSLIIDLLPAVVGGSHPVMISSCACMYVCMYVYVYVYVYLGMYTCCGWELPSCDDQLLRMYVFICICICTCRFTHHRPVACCGWGLPSCDDQLLRMYVCMCVCMYIHTTGTKMNPSCMYLCMHIRCIHTYIQVLYLSLLSHLSKLSIFFFS